MAGNIKSVFSIAGVDEYAVIEKSMAATLSKKSAISEAGSLSVKKFCRDCRADQSKAAACFHQNCARMLHDNVLGQPK